MTIAAAFHVGQVLTAHSPEPPVGTVVNDHVRTWWRWRRYDKGWTWLDNHARGPVVRIYYSWSVVFTYPPAVASVTIESLPGGES